MYPEETQYEVDRIHRLARAAGEERSLYLGEAIGNVLAIAWNAFGALGAWLANAAARRKPARGRGKLAETAR